MYTPIQYKKISLSLLYTLGTWTIAHFLTFSLTPLRATRSNLEESLCALQPYTDEAARTGQTTTTLYDY